MNKTRVIGNELLKRGRNFFSLAQIIRTTGLDRKAVRDVLLTLHSEGFLRRIHRTPEPYTRGRGPQLMNIRYRLINPKRLAEKIAPRYRGENNALDKIWKVIRYKAHSDGFFMRADIRTLTGIASQTVRWYTKMLARAGIIVTDGKSGEWRLVKDVGPRRPYVGDQIKKQ